MQPCSTCGGPKKVNETAIAAGRCITVDDALNYRLIQYALSLVQPLCRKIKILARYRLEELLHRVLAAGLPKAVVDAVSLSDQDSFFC